MKRQYHIWTVGCQMNKADSQSLGKALEGKGYAETDQLGQADVIVVNTCSVRQRAEERVVGKVNSLAALKRKNPALMLALAGCMVGPDATELHQQFPTVDVFLRPGEVDALLEALPDADAEPEERCFCGASPRKRGAVTAFVPVTYGCDNFCSYCIVPYRRGRERSRPIPEIASEIEGLVAEGVREVTLLGQNVNSYGHNLPEKPDFADLLTAVHGIAGLWRVRFVTSHPKDMTHRLIDTIAGLPRVCEYINLPVQAGDDVILEKMRRGYTVDSYRKTVAAIRQAIPGVAISTDIIVGFPGESKEQHQNTYRLVQEIRFDSVHLASFSPRPGTIAARMEDDVPPAQKW
ncbi:MAG: tRNA (N6-isopentenyl adenosine(37)-C2)-methylthiotransferase MiaB, partial [Chloroflexi bacterium]|nr:tRNA (N6-isopentenyl adenosine(37)-C2)-methylthiotransferase MiaB [Chloroflexota bacterium]